MNVTACLVTNKPDPLHMQPVLDSLPDEWEKIIWNNAGPWVIGHGPFGNFIEASADLCVYGRYAAIRYASNDLIYVQDDDVIVSDPKAITDRWNGVCMQTGLGSNHVVCNMPPLFRENYSDAALVGFGAAFHRDAPARAFARFDPEGLWKTWLTWPPSMGPMPKWAHERRSLYLRECDRLFTVLTPRVLVDVPKQDREFASAPDRLWKQPEHAASTARMLDLARKVRDQQEAPDAR